jgi:hypothetical protein
MSDQAANLSPAGIPRELSQKMAMYIQETSEIIEDLRTENTQLKEAAGTCSKCGKPNCSCGCDKKASEEALEEGRIVETVDHLIQAGFLKQSGRDQAIASVKADPANALLSFVDKLASQQITAPNALPKLGKAVAKEGQESGAAPEKEKRASDSNFEATFDHLNVD